MSKTMNIYNANCFDTLPTLADGSVDLILIDPPFGITACVWDKKPDFEKLYTEFKRVLKPNGVCIIFGDFKLLADLQTTSFRKHYSHQIVWSKLRTSNQLNAKKRPMQANELINVYNFGKVKYNPQYFYGWNKKKEWVFQKPTDPKEFLSDHTNQTRAAITRYIEVNGTWWGRDEIQTGKPYVGLNKDNEIVSKPFIHSPPITPGCKNNIYNKMRSDNEIVSKPFTHPSTYPGTGVSTKSLMNDMKTQHRPAKDNEIVDSPKGKHHGKYHYNLSGNLLNATVGDDSKRGVVKPAKDNEIVEKIQLHGGTQLGGNAISKRTKQERFTKEGNAKDNEIVEAHKFVSDRPIQNTKNPDPLYGADLQPGELKKVEAAKEGNATSLYEGEYEGNGMYNKMQIPAIYSDPGYRYPTTVAPFQKRIGKALHPTEKPVHLLEWLVKSYSDEDMVVLDCFMGSGSAGEAALNTNREFIGVEMDEAFFNVAKNRLNKERSI